MSNQPSPASSNAFTFGSGQLFRRVLTWGTALISAIALIASVLGWLFAGGNGVTSALIGAAMALVFVSLTAASVWIGGRLSLGGFFGVVLGGWILKVGLFWCWSESSGTQPSLTAQRCFSAWLPAF